MPVVFEKQTSNDLEKLYRALSDPVDGSSATRNHIAYADLTRPQQRLLTRLYGGGTLRAKMTRLSLRCHFAVSSRGRASQNADASFALRLFPYFARD